MTSSPDCEILNSALIQVDSFFSSIDSLSRQIQKTVLQKVKKKLEGYEFQDDNNDNGDAMEMVSEINHCKGTNKQLLISEAPKSSRTKRKQRIDAEHNGIGNNSPSSEKTIKPSSPAKKSRSSFREKNRTEKAVSFLHEIISRDVQKTPGPIKYSTDNIHIVKAQESMNCCFVKLEKINKSTPYSLNGPVIESEKAGHKNKKSSDERKVNTSNSNNLSYSDEDDRDEDDPAVDDPDFCYEEESQSVIGETKDKSQQIAQNVLRKGSRPKKTENETHLVCDVCSVLCKSRSLLTIHMRIHSNERPFMCELCGKSFSQKSNLDIHLKRHNGVKSFECGVCDHRAVCKVDILRHMTKHTGEHNYTCEFCGKLLTTDSSLRSHIKHVHIRSNKLFCSSCEFVTHSKDILRRHYLVKHTDSESFECPVCNAIIKQKGSFMVHMRKHTGEKPFHCSLCTKSFKSSSQLAAHRRSHREGDYLCETCSRKFKSKDHLRRHEIIHTKEKPYNCHLCSYACNVKGNLTKHIKTVHHISSFSFKKPYPTSSTAESSEEALKRGSNAAEEYLKELTVNVGEILTVEDLQKQSAEMRDILQEAKLEELKIIVKKSGNHEGEESSLLIDSDLLPTKETENSGKNSKLIPDSVITCSPDILSDAVQLLHAPISVVSDGDEALVDVCNPQYESIPFEIGSNMFIIQVVSDQTTIYPT